MHVGRRVEIVALASRANGSNTRVTVDNTFASRALNIYVRCTVGGVGGALTVTVRARDTKGNEYVLVTESLPCEAGSQSALMLGPSMPATAGVSAPMNVPRDILIQFNQGTPAAATWEASAELM